MVANLNSAKYDAYPKDWDIDYIKQVEKIYNQIARGIQYQK